MSNDCTVPGVLRWHVMLLLACCLNSRGTWFCRYFCSVHCSFVACNRSFNIQLTGVSELERLTRSED